MDVALRAAGATAATPPGAGTRERGASAWLGHPPAPGACAAKARYRQSDASCTLAVEGDGRFALRFDAPQWAVTPGQSAVVYDGEVCLGGGVIAGAAGWPEGAAAAAVKPKA